MRISASTAPARTGKQRLLTSCAIAAGMAALALGGPALAQVQGSGSIIGGAGTIQSTGQAGIPPATTRVTTTTAQTIINWTPTDTAPAGAPIDFLPATNTLEFYGTGQYTVLNRFIAVDPLTGLNIPISRQIALNGNVNSYVGSPAAGAGAVQGGNIWFYNAGGILIGARAVINVGSLVLTANDIDTTGGLFGPNNEIRFRGAAGSTSSIDISPQSFISAANPGNPGSSYIALVAPRINQGGLIDVDGSAALVAAEQADVTINNGLFDINVTVGAEGGNAITHTGVTSGPAHAQGDTDQSRIYLVAIPKNDAVTMLISGQLGYQDAVVAQTDPDGAVVLSAGYNIENGAVSGPAVGPANITIADTIFQSSVNARASGDLLAGPLATIPAGGPVVAAPPPHIGRLVVQGNANFIGDASATLNVGANQLVGATGNMVVQSNGANGVAGNATVNVTGGGLAVLGTLNITANGIVDAVTGDATGGTAAFNISGGTTVVGANVVVSAAGNAGFDAAGNGGDGTGGNASLTVENGGSLTADVITVQANGRGGGFTSSITLGTQVADVSGNGQGGTATLTAQNGGNITANTSINVNATGTGATGTTQSGNGTGGTATLRILTGGTSVTSPLTNIDARGIGGGTISLPIFGTFLSANAGDGEGGTAEIEQTTDFSSPSSLGALTLTAAGIGGGANGANATGGNAIGGDVIVTASQSNLTVDTLVLDASATGGSAEDAVGANATSGDATGGAINITADGGATLGTTNSLTANASAIAGAANNVGSSDGGNINVLATGLATITVGTDLLISADAGQFSTTIPTSAGISTGGDVDLTADGGTITVGSFSVTARSISDNVTGTSGRSLGGTIDIRAANTGLINAVDSAGVSFFSVDAAAGVSQGGTAATGGRIGVTIDGGTLDFGHNSFFSSTGIAGGDTSAAGNIVLGLGGTILFELLDNALNPSTLNFQTISATADGRAAAPFEGAAFLRGTAAGNGGNLDFNVQGGQMTGTSLLLSASGFSGIVTGNTGEGRGGQATYTQTGGDVTVGDLVVDATGFGGNGGRILTGGSGFGGTATINLNGGTLDATNISAVAAGAGGMGQTGDDSDPVNPVDGTNGGFGQGGTATVNLDGTAVVTTTTLNAFASGIGGDGGNFVSTMGVVGRAGNGGDALGGTAEINLTDGTLTTGDVTADAGGFGGFGGNLSDLSSIPAAGSVVGGNGGNGQGGTATIDVATAVTAGGTVSSFAIGAGGGGGAHHVGGAGGEGRGGTAELIVTDFNTGNVTAVLDASALGGDGGDGLNGAGGQGGFAQGGIARVQAEGENARAVVTDANFVTTGTGGAGGDAALYTGNSPRFGPNGGNGGDGRGGSVELIANLGTIELGVGRLGVAALTSQGFGGDGGNGADNPGNMTLPGPDGMPGTMDDIVVGFVGGQGGIGGGGLGGTVRLGVDGGTLTSNGNPVSITAGGTSGDSGIGGAGEGGSLGDGGSFVDQGGTVIFEAFSSPNGNGTMSFGDVNIDASGFLAGRIDIRSAGTITMTSLTASAQGSSSPTNNDTDLATTGIFLGITDGGLIQTDGAVTLDTTDLNGNPGASVGVYAQGDGQLNVGGTLTVNAGDQIDIRHDFRDGTAPTIQTGGLASFTAVTTIRSAPGSLVAAGTSLVMNATGFNSAIDIDSIAADRVTLLLAANGRINVYGTSTSGIDLTANARDEVAIADATAGDDISLSGNTVVAGNLITNGTGLDSELDGSNIFVGTTGAASVDHAEADNDFTANVGSFSTGLDTIITGGDIDIIAAGAVDLGNSQAGGFIAVNGQSITFNAIEAGTTVGLNATGTAPGAEGILGNSIVAGGDVNLFGNTIRINDGVTTTGSLFASSSGGNARLSATTDGDIIINSTGDIAGTYAAGGNVSLTAATNITAQANAAGTYVGPNGPSEGYVFFNAAGDANVLAGTSAATMIGVRAGTNANVDGVTAGEDLYVLAGNTATVTNSTAGDDMIVTGTCCVIVDNVSTTGAGPDGRSLIFAPSTAGGPDVWQLQTGPTDLSNIVLTASAGTIDASNAVAFDNLTATASDVVRTTNTIRSGLVTTITGSSLDLESVTAGTDIVLTSTAGGISAIGALSAGHDLTVTSATTGQFADLAAGDDIRITASGDVSAASVLATAGGLDNDIDGSGAYIDTAGNIAITGTTNTVGQTRLTAGGTVDTGAITADFTVIDAVGAVNITGDVISSGIFIEGASIDMQSAISNLGQIVLRATDGDITADGDVTTLSSLEVDAAGAIAITGTATGGNYVQMQGASIDVADVNSSSFVFLTATGGQINATGTISAGSDVILDAATGGTLGALVAGDDVSITAGGDVTVASISADGTNPQGEEIGSNVVGSVAGTLTVTGSTFAASDVTFDATSLSLQDVEAGGALTATTTGGPITLTSADVGANIILTSARTVTATGTLDSGLATTVRGTGLDLQGVSAGTNIGLTATTGNIVTNGHVVAGGNIVFGAGGDIDHDNDSLLRAGNDMTLTAGGDIDVGNASSGGDMSFGAGGAIAANALTSTRNILLDAGGLIELTGDVDAGLSLRAEGASIELNDIAVDVGELGLAASTGGVHATGTINANGPLSVIAAGAVDMTGDIDAAAVASIRGASVTVGNVTGGSNIELIATNGAVNSAGTIDAGANIFISTTAGGTFNRLIAGDDIGIIGSGDVSVTFMDATGDNPEGEEIGSNVEFNLAGNVTVGHGEAAGDFIVNANSFSTGLNSIIAEDDIEITTSGATNLGNSTAGGSIQVEAQSVAFNALDAGDFVNLNATGATPGAAAIEGGSILAGTDVFLIGNSIAVGTIEAGGLLSAFGSGGDVTIDNASAASNIGVIAVGNIAGSYAAGGDIEMSADGNIAVTANAAGGAPDPSNGDVNTAGNLFIDAVGNVTLTGSGAGMVGVRAGGSATLSGVTAGEDMLVLAGTTAGLSSITVGDDLDVIAGGDVSAFGVSATAEGPDGFQLAFSSTSGFTIGQGEGVSTNDGADIDIRSTGGAVQSGGLSAGDDIFLAAASTLSVSGATTRGLGQTGGDSSIRTQSGNASFAGLDAFDDIVINSSGMASLTAPSRAGRDVRITASATDLADLTAPNSAPIDTLQAGRDLTITTGGAITGGSLSAGRDLTLAAGEDIVIRRATTGSGGAMTLDGATGVFVDTLNSAAATVVTAGTGDIRLGTLNSAGPISLVGDSIGVDGVVGNAVFANIETDVGDAFIFGGSNVSITAGSVAGRALIRSDGSLSVTQLAGNEVELGADTVMTLGNVTATNALGVQVRDMLTVNGAVVGRSMIIASGDITIGSAGRLGTQGTTQALEVRNIDEDSVTYIGGTGTRTGYHIDQTEMTRLFGNDITILAPDLGGNNGGFVAAAPGGPAIATVGSSTPPTVIIDDFTLTAGGPTSNLGASGSLTIATQGKARVIGDAAITGMSDANSFRIIADEALEVILGEGTIRLSGSATSTPAGRLILQSEDVIVATADAIADVAAAPDIDAIDERLGQNDGIILDDGALFAGGIDVTVEGGFYVQNSGEGTRFAQRRGLTFGPLGLNVNVAGADSRIVINGVHLGPSGQVTGLDAIPLLSIDGFVIGSGPLSGSGLAFDSGSTMNGCLIVSSTTCAFLEFESSFPVQDVINDEDEDEQEGDDADGMSLPTPLITMRDLDPLTGEPLLDDPVTGAGNDDLWTPPAE